MRKVEYGDVNRFLVSIGIILVGLSILSPYLYLKEDFGLYMEAEKLEKLKDPIKELVLDKQHKIKIIQKYLPLISIGLFVVGLLSVGIGLYRWFKRQDKIDQKFDGELKKLNFELKALTPEETENKAKEEAEEVEVEEKANLISSDTTYVKGYLDYMRVEKDISDVFSRYNSPNFNLLSQQRIDGKYEVDLLLQAKSRKFSDRVIEVKYFKNHFPLSLIQRTLYKLEKLTSYYKKTRNTRVVPVLLIVYNQSIIDEEKISLYQERVFSYSEEMAGLTRLKVEFIAENQVSDFDVRKILKR